jgi:hypothetical protein
VLVLGGVDLVHARIDQCPDAALREAGGARVFGDGEQAVDRQHKLTGTEGQPLRHRARGAQAGERARAAAEGNGVDVGERNAGVAEQAKDRWQ